MIRHCKHCVTDKDISEFRKDARKKYGRGYICKPCSSTRTQRRHQVIRDSNNQIALSAVCTACSVDKPASCFYLAPERPNGLLAKCKDCRAAVQSTYYANNKEVFVAADARRRAALLQQDFSKGYEDDIKEVYAEAQRLTDETGVPHEVDHIVPLQGKTVRGLHAPWNLQILPASINRSKSNTWEG